MAQNSLINAELDRRFYRWSLGDAEREIAEGFPLVGSIGSSICSKTLAYIETLALEEQLATTRALVKRFHPNAALSTGERLTNKEEDLLSKKDEALLSREFENVIKDKLDEPRMARSKRESLIRQTAINLLGQPSSKERSGARFETRFGPWIVETEVCWGSCPFYLHRVQGQHGHRFLDFVSILSWLGICSTTKWDLARRGDEAEVAASMGAAMQHFLDSATNLFVDLHPK